MSSQAPSEEQTILHLCGGNDLKAQAARAQLAGLGVTVAEFADVYSALAMLAGKTGRGVCAVVASVDGMDEREAEFLLIVSHNWPELPAFVYGSSTDSSPIQVALNTGTWVMLDERAVAELANLKSSSEQACPESSAGSEAVDRTRRLVRSEPPEVDTIEEPEEGDDSIVGHAHPLDSALEARLQASLPKMSDDEVDLLVETSTSYDESEVVIEAETFDGDDILDLSTGKMLDLGRFSPPETARMPALEPAEEDEPSTDQQQPASSEQASDSQPFEAAENSVPTAPEFDPVSTDDPEISTEPDESPELPTHEDSEDEDGVRVPWLRYSGDPIRRPPGAEIEDHAEETSDVAQPADTPARSRHDAPLLSEEELDALIGDGVTLFDADDNESEEGDR